MTTLPSEGDNLDAPNTLLLLGLATSLLAVSMGPLLPSYIRGATLMLLAAGVIWSAAAPHRREQNQTLMFWPILLVLLGVLPGLFDSIDLQISQNTLALLPVGFVLFLGICMTDGPGRTVMSLASLMAVFLISLDGTIQYLFANGYFATRDVTGDPVTPSTPHSNDISILPMLLPIAVLGIARSSRRVALVAGSILVPLVVFTVITSWSRNAWIGLCIVSIGLAVWKDGAMRICIGCGLIIAMLLVAIDVADVQNRLMSLADPMTDGRIGLWLAAMAMFLEQPFTGMGPGTFGFAYPDVVSMVQLPVGYQAESGFIPWAHNMYLELLAEYGLPGFLAYAIVTTWLLSQLTALAIFGAGGQSGTGSDDARAWAIALLLSWLTMLSMAMFDLSFSTFRFTYIYWMIVGLSFSIVIRSSSRTTSRDDCDQKPTIL